jgi:hypothetical protein
MRTALLVLAAAVALVTASPTLQHSMRHLSHHGQWAAGLALLGVAIVAQVLVNRAGHRRIAARAGQRGIPARAARPQR